MKKWRKYILCILIVTICGAILSFISNESVLICDIYVMMCILLFEKWRIKLMNLTFIQMLIAFLIVYTCVYALVNRIATCIERCAMAKSVSKIDIFDGEKKEEDTNESVILK